MDVPNLDREEAGKDTAFRIARDVEEHGVWVVGHFLQCMPSPDDANCVAENIFVGVLPREIAMIFDGDGDAESQKESREKEVPRLQAQIGCLLLACARLQRNGKVTNDCS